ncbi:ABC transporter ATP-binding protein [Paenibacillus rhizoplanae]|uniref:ABC transporter ATP-binding protein n=1 Tax=Paenibacillus rhizoplanae TaxID=1917181 RepID=A0ABW5FIR9_9BACL
MTTLLEVRDLAIELRGTQQPIVKHSSFSLKQGSTLAIVGESGSGKSMTCKAIMGLLNHKMFNISGSIRYLGTELIGLEERLLRSLCGSKMAMIVQNPMTAFDPASKIGAQIIETLQVHRKMTKAEAYALGLAALEKLNLSRCEQLMNSYPHTLSGGMLQRIIIALSLILEPEIIIADEATTALDVRNQGIVLDELDSIKQSGIGLILVTHDFGVAARLADEVIVMKEGLIIETGTIHEVFTSPRDTYTQELLQASLLKREVKL